MIPVREASEPGRGPTHPFARRTAVALCVLAVALMTTQAIAGAAGEIISTVAGTGVAGDTGDGGPATSASISMPRSVSATPDGGFVFAEPYTHRVRRVSANGTISTLAGSGIAGFSGDGGPATAARLNFVHAASPTPDGGMLLADTHNNRIRRVSARGTIFTVAGTGAGGYNGDSQPATAASINQPRGVAALPDGGFLIADSGNHRIRRVAPSGIITTVAGMGQAGFSGDGGPATLARLNLPFYAVTSGDGGILVADTANQRIRRISPAGTITTAAGTGAAGYGGDGGPATSAPLNNPHSLVAAPGGGFLVADTSNNRVRVVDVSGIITTLAGNGAKAFGGDSGPATSASLNQPKGVAVTAQGGVLVADEGNNRIRLVSAGAPTTTTTTSAPTSSTTVTTAPTTTTSAPTTTTTPTSQNPACLAIRQRAAQTTDPATRQALASAYAAYGCGTLGT